jgi:hypothetical protein
MTVNAKIRTVDYNNIRTKVTGVLGVGSIDYGYGQTVRSSAVTESNKITINEWGNLYYDIVNCFVHQTGAGPASAVSTTDGATIKSDADGVTFNGAISGTTLIAYNQSGATSMLAIGQTLTSGGGVGRSITASINNLPITITSFTSKTLSSGSYLVVYAITTQPVALPFGNNTSVIISGNSNANYNGTFPITASTTTSITVQYSSDPGTYGSGTTTVTVTPYNPWGYSTWTITGSGTVAYSAMTAANSTTRHPITQYDDFANTIVANRFDVGAGQSFTTTKGTVSETWPGTYGASWSTTIRSTIRVQFTSAANARHFFNSGGEIRFNSSRSGSTTRAQDLAWTTLLSTAATKAFGGNKPTTGVGTLNGQNFYRLTSTFQEWTSTAYSSPYTANRWRITARCRDVADNSLGTSADIEFQSEWIDGYVDPGNFPLDVPDDVDKVTGTISLTVSTLEATGILQPVGTGSFVVESPIVTVSAITP